MVVGFIQTGPEGAWRTANNASFDEAATQLGITLKVYDSQGKVENQISAFHTFNQDPDCERNSHCSRRYQRFR